MPALNIKLIMIVISIICLATVAGFSLWIILSGPRMKKEVKGAAISQEELTHQLEQSVFGDVVK